MLFVWISREQELEYVRTHVRSLQLAMQRHRGWVKSMGNYERLMERVWAMCAEQVGFRTHAQTGVGRVSEIPTDMVGARQRETSRKLYPSCLRFAESWNLAYLYYRSEPGSVLSRQDSVLCSWLLGVLCEKNRSVDV